MLKVYGVENTKTNNVKLHTVCTFHVKFLEFMGYTVVQVETVADSTCYICDMIAEAGRMLDESMEARDA